MRICDPPPPASSPASPPASPPAGLLPGRPCREAVALGGATARKHRPNATGWACKYRLWAVIAPPGFRLRHRFAGLPCAIGTPVAKPFLLGISLTVEQRTLTPSVLVRIQDPQPTTRRIFCLCRVCGFYRAVSGGCESCGLPETLRWRQYSR